MISAGELAGLRRAMESTMSDSVQILRPVDVADAGGMATTYTVVATVICRVAPEPRSRSGEQVIGGALVGAADWRVTVPAETDVRTSDMLSVGSALSGSGLTAFQVGAGGGRLFQITSVAGPRTLEMQRIIYANEIG